MIISASIVNKRFQVTRVEGRKRLRPARLLPSKEQPFPAFYRSAVAIPSDRLLVHKTPLVFEQPFLTPQTAAVTTERTIRSNDAMTRNNDANHVLAVGASDCATHLNIAKFFRHP